MHADPSRPGKEVGQSQRHKGGKTVKMIKTRYLSPPAGKDSKGRKKSHKQTRISGEDQASRAQLTKKVKEQGGGKAQDKPKTERGQTLI